MKRILFIVGLILMIVSLVSLIPNALVYSDLSEYERGIFWGKAIIFLAGAVLVYFGRRNQIQSGQN